MISLSFMITIEIILLRIFKPSIVIFDYICDSGVVDWVVQVCVQMITACNQSTTELWVPQESNLVNFNKVGGLLHFTNVTSKVESGCDLKTCLLLAGNGEEWWDHEWIEKANKNAKAEKLYNIKWIPGLV